MSCNRKVVIIDDDKDLAEVARWDVEELGYEPFLIVDGGFGSVSELISEIPTDTYAVLSDHRLAGSGLAQGFDGAELVATLYEKRVPAILETQFYQIDSDVSIRKRRHKIPVLLTRNNVDSSSIQAGIEACIKELNGEFSLDRKPYRNILRIVDISEEANETVVDTIIPSWDPKNAVRLPLSLIHEWLLNFQPVIGNRLIAKVNTGAKSSEDLYFTDFELAPKYENS